MSSRCHSKSRSGSPRPGPGLTSLLALSALALACDVGEPLRFDIPGATESRGHRMPSTRRVRETPPLLPRTPCPDVTTLEEALDASEARFEAGELAAAYSCAELASDLAPQAVEAHHLRAAALAALGRVGDAQIAFATALALDPEDPETLAAASDFFINVVRPRSRDHLLLGQEYARRGSSRAATRRRADRQLRARLLLLEAEAMNDLGSSDLALPRINESLALVPDWLEAEHERAVSLFNLARFEEARDAFLGVLERAPHDPYAHYHVALTAEHLGDAAIYARHMNRVREIAPVDLAPPLAVGVEEFRAEVAEAISELTAEERALLEHVELELVDLPALDDLRAVEPPFAPTIMGLYRGLPVGAGEGAPEIERPIDFLLEKGGATLPRAVVLYRKNLLRVARTRDELDAQVRRTLRHELGHAAGLDEDQLRRLGLE